MYLKTLYEEVLISVQACGGPRIPRSSLARYTHTVQTFKTHWSNMNIPVGQQRENFRVACRLWHRLALRSVSN